MTTTLWRAPMRRLAITASATLVLILGAALIAAPTAQGASSSFKDVPTSHQFKSEITWLANKGITTGYADGTFKPKSAVTREAFAAFLYRLEGSPRVALPSKSPFKDVSRSDKFFKEIVWLKSTGITTGWADGTFRPKDNISREAMAAFLYRASGEDYWWGYDELFTDVSYSAKFFDEIDWLAAEGITTGYTAGYGCREFRPKDAITREAMAAFLYRFDTGKGTPLTSVSCNPPAPSKPAMPADKDCGDFATHAQAQAWFMKYYPYYGDFARLDREGDMLACEWLP